MNKDQNNQSKNEPGQGSSENQLINYAGGYVTLPFNQDQFRDFVISLLGRPQTIEKRVYGRFEVNLQDLQSFHYLIDQRLTQQNNALLSQFSAKIYFSDDSSITLSSFEELMTYNEIRPLVSVAVDLTWDYLVQFNHKTHPEKQGIDIRIWTEDASERYKTRRHGEIVVVGSSESRSFFNITIRHTARTWGMDIEALLTSHVQSFILPQDSFKNFVSKNNGWIGLIAGIFFFASSVASVFWATENFVKNQLNQIDTSLNAATDTSSKISVIAQYLVSGQSTRYYLLAGMFLLLTLIASIAVGAVVGTKATSEEPSFLLLTQGASRNKQKKLNKTRTHWRDFIFSIIISVLTNIVASYIFVYITR